ncbi:hypothetical protein A167_00274 [Alcanivorax sp. S71-1-4]|uniref:hypothetical protein n=1 Tax=Alcanivorax sp. S71-1-4 TaxID=1177159 RepID=UPI0013577684|nr:hypothetical protein [Alcanivorax sp. S71-1-4]KAF0810787.1 hypothetical protein A167_00274 [Alcanivorax sp. S71-1-4]
MKDMLIRRLIAPSLVAGILAITGCQNSPTMPDGATRCEKTGIPPERAVCTMIHDPVCGFGEDGQAMGQFGNSCQACAQPPVMSWRRGECE